MVTMQTSAFRRVKPQTLGQTVEDTVIEALTNRARNPEAGERSAWHRSDALDMVVEEQASWPMPVERFRYGQYLEPGDIVLSTRLGGLFSYLVRRIDRSEFAHAALVFLTPRHYAGVDRSYLLEATFSGVDIDAFSEIIAPSQVDAEANRPPRYIVGVKRLEADWFTPELRMLIAGRMLRFIKDDDYNFTLLAALATQQSRFFFRLRDRLFGRAPTIREFVRQSKKFAPAEFICSGFVQFAYIDVLRLALEMGLIHEDIIPFAKRDVLFAPWATPTSSIEDMMAVKPVELAESDRLKWKYLIFNGEVHQVSSNEDVRELYQCFTDHYNGRS